MKKLLSILLAVAMVASLVIAALPAIAAETTYDVRITSDIMVDEAYQDAGGGIYWWHSHGKFDAIVAGQELKNINLNNLRQAIYEAYQIDAFESIDFQNQYENPWSVGNKYPVTFDFKYWSEEAQSEVTLVSLSANVMVHETKIASVTAKPITIYEGGQGIKDI